jgi:hypothetical protein
VKEILEGLFINFLWEFLLASAFAALIAYLKATREKWAGPILYGAAGFALVFFIGFTLTGRSPLSNAQPETMPENIQANIRAWADEFDLFIQKQDVHNFDPAIQSVFGITGDYELHFSGNVLGDVITGTAMVASQPQQTLGLA